MKNGKDKLTVKLPITLTVEENKSIGNNNGENINNYEDWNGKGKLYKIKRDKLKITKLFYHKNL